MTLKKSHKKNKNIQIKIIKKLLGFYSAHNSLRATQS